MRFHVGFEPSYDAKPGVSTQLRRNRKVDASVRRRFENSTYRTHGWKLQVTLRKTSSKRVRENGERKRCPRSDGPALLGPTFLPAFSCSPGGGALPFISCSSSQVARSRRERRRMRGERTAQAKAVPHLLISPFTPHSPSGETPQPRSREASLPPPTPMATSAAVIDAPLQSQYFSTPHTLSPSSRPAPPLPGR
jgi:hypothetical protein